METHEPNVYPTILGGALQGFRSPFLDWGARISNRSLSVVNGSITLKFFGGALGTSPHQWFNRVNEIPKKCFLGHSNIPKDISTEKLT